MEDTTDIYMELIDSILETNNQELLEKFFNYKKKIDNNIDYFKKLSQSRFTQIKIIQDQLDLMKNNFTILKHNEKAIDFNLNGADNQFVEHERCLDKLFPEKSPKLTYDIEKPFWKPTYSELGKHKNSKYYIKIPIEKLVGIDTEWENSISEVGNERLKKLKLPLFQVKLVNEKKTDSWKFQSHENYIIVTADSTNKELSEKTLDFARTLVLKKIYDTTRWSIYHHKTTLFKIS